MIAPLFDNCVICGRRTRKPGERLCVKHDIEYLIAIGASRMRAAMRGEILITGQRILPESKKASARR